MTIAPVAGSVTVRVTPATAFDLFTTRIDAWWDRRKSIGSNPQAEVVLEAGVGGRLFERDGDGRETSWGEVLVWEAPARLVLAWRIDAEWKYDTDFGTEVEIRFEPAGDGATRVSLEHRNLERYGPSAERIAGNLAGGWLGLLNRYEQLANKEEG